ncbi:hypothetical protein F2Q68_00003548 [Brassica cretica]|uniref:Uncharacterized protein n=1 Tax=Brassica cretica TaxID=69181 RepID=A0A8S9JEF0_BRACR|nr:hypothetical protein F2Q68_00003548 [Brassica cretica]
MMSQPPRPLITSSFVSQGRRRLVLVNDALIKHCASLCSINTDEPEPDLTNERHRSLTNIQANNLLSTHDLNTRLRMSPVNSSFAKHEFKANSPFTRHKFKVNSPKSS